MFDDSLIDLLNTLDEGITAIDNNSKIAFINSKAAHMEDIDIATAIGRHILEVYPSLSYKTSTLLNVLNTGQAIYDYLQTFQNYKGENITTVNTTIPIKKNKKIIGAIEISRDMTTVKRLSDEVLELRSELVHKINEMEGIDEIKNKDVINVGEVTHEKSIYDKDVKGYTFMDIIGQSDLMLKLKAYALKAAATASSVLVYGETGTGKELIVQSIHNTSPRKYKPFIAQNCAALPSTLLEGILFGTVRGSFTGAEDKPGLFELANGGTLYLDELNSMPLDLQAKLLRVIQDGVVRRVGDTKETSVDVRIIASINVEPGICLKDGIIRSDLYYRLNVIGLSIPELRKRKSDIPMMIDHFITKYNKKLRTKIKGITRAAMDRMLAYDWPGNVRELQHTIERIMNLKDSGYIEVEDLPEGIINASSKSINESLEEFERIIIQDALKTWDNNISKAAKYLKIPRQTLQYKVKRFNLNI